MSVTNLENKPLEVINAKASTDLAQSINICKNMNILYKTQSIKKKMLIF